MPSSRLRGSGAWPLIGRLRLTGILTKPDLVDRGTESKVVDVAQNLVCHLKKGYMIVKCRGQQDIQDQVTLAEALQKERDFFEDHPHFRYPAVFSRGRTKTWGEGLLPKSRHPQRLHLGSDRGSPPEDQKRN